jgi:hypothetical protein
VRTSHHDDPVAQRFTAGFIKEWNISNEKIGRIAMPFRLSPPLATNPRVENLLKRAFPGRVAEYYRSEFLSIQVAVA